jgi:hypothetical protein
LVRRLRPEVPLALEAVIYRALRRRPEERYASMFAFQHDLQNLDAVVFPEKYERDEPPPAPLGDLPPWRTSVPGTGGVVPGSAATLVVPSRGRTTR